MPKSSLRKNKHNRMISGRLAPYIFIIVGVLFVLSAYPKIHKQTIERLQDANILPRFKLKPKDREILAGAGKNLSLGVIGLFLIFFGIVLIVFKNE